jgi:protein O-GlcNAc transferase
LLSESASSLLAAAVASSDPVAQAELLTRLVQSPDFDDADYRACERALAGAASPAEALLHFGAALLAAGRSAAALRAYEKAIDTDPDFFPAYLAAGAMLLKQRAFARARDHVLEAVAIDPDSAEAQNLLGVVLRAMGRSREAIECFEAAGRLGGGLVYPHFNLALAWRDLGLEHLAVAIDALRKALAIDPAYFPAVTHLAGLLSEEGRWQEALMQSERALAMRPDEVSALWRRCFQQLPVVLGQLDIVDERRRSYAVSLDELCTRLGERPPQSPEAIETLVGLDGPFNLAYQAQDDTDLQRRYGALITRLMQQWQSQVMADNAATSNRNARMPRENKRIRVGVVSSFIRHHSVWHANIRGFAAHLPRERFSVFSYDTAVKVTSGTSPEAALFDEHVSGNLSLADWVSRIREDCPDVLYFPDTCMDATSLKLAALRLAPAQLAGWGHPETTGLPTIDYYLSGELFEPPQGDAHYVEKLVRLPALGTCYVPVGVRPSRIDWRELEIPDDGFVRYLCCQSVFKYLPQYDRVFPDIAGQVGRCRFIFISDRVPHRMRLFRERLEAAFGSRGLDARQYCTFIDPLPLTRLLGLIRQSDVYLDTIGFSGFSTAMMALEQGCPVVTVEGEFMRGRLASGVLRRIGVVETIAADMDGYVRIASALGTDAKARGRLAARIRESVPLAFDDRAPVAALAGLLESLVAS